MKNAIALLLVAGATILGAGEFDRHNDNPVVESLRLLPKEGPLPDCTIRDVGTFRQQKIVGKRSEWTVYRLYYCDVSRGVANWVLIVD